MCAKTLVSQTAVEGFDEGVVGGLAGPAEVDRDPIGLGPEIAFRTPEPIHLPRRLTLPQTLSSDVAWPSDANVGSISSALVDKLSAITTSASAVFFS